MMCYAEKPRRQRSRIVEMIELSIRLEQRILGNILTIKSRTCHARTVAVQLGANVRYGFEKCEVARLDGIFGNGSRHFDVQPR